MKKILLTGFEPFFSFTVNPTMKIVEELDGTTIEKYEVTIRVLTVDFEQSGAQLIHHQEGDKARCSYFIRISWGRYKIGRMLI